jgi:hypothetical protein
MADLFHRGLDPVPGSAEIQSEGAPKKRGRPKGAKNKTSGDLLKWVANETGGLTPGQQLARLAMVTPKDIRNAKRWALEEIGSIRPINIKAIDPLVLGMAYKATQLAQLMGWDKRDAWAAIQKASADLLPYMHQKQASKEAEKPDNRGVILMSPMALGSMGNPSQSLDFQGDFLLEIPDATQPKPHNQDQSLIDQGFHDGVHQIDDQS